MSEGYYIVMMIKYVKLRHAYYYFAFSFLMTTVWGLSSILLCLLISAISRSEVSFPFPFFRNR